MGRKKKRVLDTSPPKTESDSARNEEELSPFLSPHFKGKVIGIPKKGITDWKNSQGEFRERYGYYIFQDLETANEEPIGFDIVAETDISTGKSRNYLIWLMKDGQAVSDKKPKVKELEVSVEKVSNDLADSMSVFMEKDDALTLLKDLRIYVSNHKNYFKSEKLVDDTEGSDELTADILRSRGYNVDETDEDVLKFKEILKGYGHNITTYLTQRFDDLILDEASNMFKQIWMVFSVELGRGSFFDGIIADTGQGKSKTIETALDYFLPSEYIEKVNDFTEASFKARARQNPREFSRTVLYFGDLGNEDRFRKVEPIFDIGKILVTEKTFKSYISEKMEDGQRWNPVATEIDVESICVAYTSVKGSKTSNTEQIQSRAIISTPQHQKSLRTFKFNNRLGIKGSEENAFFEKTVKELELFKKYQLYLVNLYYKLNQTIIENGITIHQSVSIFNPFEEIFYKLGADEGSGIRNATILTELLASMTFLNYDFSYKFVKEREIGENEIERTLYLFPAPSDLENFIEVVYSSAGLDPRLKELLLALQKEFVIIEDEVENEAGKSLPYYVKSVDPRTITEELKGQNNESQISLRQIAVNVLELEDLADELEENPNKSRFIEVAPLVDKEISLDTFLDDYPKQLNRLYDRMGINSKNYKQNKRAIKKYKEKADGYGENPSKDEQKSLESIAKHEYRPLSFFTVQELRKNIQKKGIKGVKDLGEVVATGYEKGFIAKFRAKQGKGNVYYLTRKAENVHSRFKIDDKDISQAFKNIRELRLNPLKRNGESLFDEMEVKEMEDDYSEYFKERK